MIEVLLAVVGVVLLFPCALVMVVVRPWERLPEPDGPYTVGTVRTTLVDPNRSRELAVRAWYPAQGSSTAPKEPLWSDLQNSPETPLALKVLGKLVSVRKTNSRRGAPFAGSVEGLLLYHHGLISFSSENTLLMEHLASHGFVVLAVQHLGQLREYQDLVGNQGTEEAADLSRQLQVATSRAERARLSFELCRAASGTSEIVSRRCADSQHVLDHAHEVLAQVPGLRLADVDLEAVGALGLSLGGAVATRLAIHDERVVAAANLDGGLYGVPPDRSIHVPYLMLYSEPNEGGNDLLLEVATSGFLREVTVAGTKHMDFHDAKVVLPILGHFGALGKIGRDRLRQLRDDEVRQLFEGGSAEIVQ